MTFIPPAVEPAQPPMKLEKIRSTGTNNGHTEKSVVVKPVLVMTDVTWKRL